MSSTISEMMEAYALDAVDYSNSKFGAELDFNVDSIRQLETITGRLYDARPKGFLSKLLKKGPTAEDVRTMSMVLGGYLGEVIRRHHGGTWGRNDDMDAIGLQIGQTWIFPPAKVFHRLTEGPENDLWGYYNVLATQM